VTSLLLVVSCKPKYPASPKYKVVSAEQIRNFIVSSNKVHTLYGEYAVDNEYAVPTVDWIKSNYTEHLKQFLFDYQLSRPSEGDNDCDKFAQYGITVGHIMHHHTANKPKGSSLAVGEFIYMEGLEVHDINFFVAIDKDDQLKLVFYEPQLQSIIEIDPTDTAVFSWRM